MDFIKKIILIAVLVFATFSFQEVSCAEIKSNATQTISALRHNEKDLINNKENNFSISSVQTSNTTINSRRKNNTQANGGNIVLFLENNSSLEFLISRIQNNLHLENKNELALLFLKHQVHPNAP